MTDDWLTDETMTEEETLARFAALNPEPARGPYTPDAGLHIAMSTVKNVVVFSVSGVQGSVLRSSGTVRSETTSGDRVLVS